jgi:hypothetical protein
MYSEDVVQYSRYGIQIVIMVLGILKHRIMSIGVHIILPEYKADVLH